MRYERLFFPLLLFLTFFCACERGKGFCLKKIISNHSFNPKWETSSPTLEEKKEIILLLKQSFYYLGSGNHCYAFVSEDGTYVVKFFKQKHMNTSSWSQKTFFPKQWSRRKENRKASFTSYKLAFEHLRKETALLYIQLNKKKELGQTITLVDQYGTSLCIATDDSEFIIQKKAIVGYARLKELIEKGNLEELKKALFSLFELVANRCKKGLDDSDLQLYKNLGFIGNEAIEIDVGELKINEEAKSTKHLEKELDYIHSQLEQWTKENFPEQKPLLSQITQEAKTFALARNHL